MTPAAELRERVSEVRLGNTDGVLVRRRTDDDLDACEALAREVHRVDGYPPHLPGDDVRNFMLSPAIDAWVAEVGGRVAGHVALNERSTANVMALASRATGRPEEGLAVVARLAVAPACRRQGAGRALLATATDASLALGRWPVLDVVTQFAGAIALYERCGWRRAGEVTLDLDDVSLRELVFIGPSP